MSYTAKTLNLKTLGQTVLVPIITCRYENKKALPIQGVTMVDFARSRYSFRSAMSIFSS